MKTGLGQTTLAGEVKRTTDSAVLLEPNIGSEFWVPRRVCLQGGDIDVGDTDIVVADWWLDQNGVAP